MLLTTGAHDFNELIGPHRTVLTEEVIPARFEAYPDSPYQQGYDWLFLYERRIAAFLGKWLGRSLRYELIGEKGLLCEALSNAFYHGHQRNPQLPIGVQVIVGERGLIVRISDSGPGFDVAAVIDDYFKRRQYYSSAGNGLRLMVQSQRFAVYYNKHGNIFSLLYRFDGGYGPLCVKKPLPDGDAS